MPELSNKIELKFLKRPPGDKKEEPVKPKKPEEKSALKSGNKSDAKSPAQRVKIAPYAYVEVRVFLL